jgi:methylation protein EvaC
MNIDFEKRWLGLSVCLGGNATRAAVAVAPNSISAFCPPRRRVSPTQKLSPQKRAVSEPAANVCAIPPLFRKQREKMLNCRVCGSAIKPFMTFGRMPISNGFLTPTEFSQEYFYELASAFCERCGTLQIVDQPDAGRMFHDKYAFFTRTSKRMVAHFANYAEWALSRFLTKPNPFVVEIGCNDGAMLENFSRRGIRQLGIEPSANVAAEAERHGIRAMVAFFNLQTAQMIRDRDGPADAILAANVICHIPDINDVARGVAHLLADKGVFIFEEPYLGAMIEKGSYDQVYDEHVFIFSAASVQNAFRQHGLELIDVLPQTTHGGSMRYVLARQGAYSVGSEVALTLAKECEQGLAFAETYEAFRVRCERSRDQLTNLIRDLRAGGHRVVGYGATSKSTTVLNYCGLGPQDIEFISDTTPIKQKKFTPGTHIPVLDHNTFAKDYPEYALLFAWNHEAEILEKETAYVAAGGKWIKFVPDVSIA